MEITSVDPDRLSISDLNERKGFDDPDADDGHIEIDDLTESVAEIGIVQPPLVRPFDGEYKAYEVVIGQRRTLAAQEVKNFDMADLGEIPIIVVDWDDGEALASSIVENVDAFREEVGTADRARAIDRLKNLRGWSDQEVADHLGVARKTVENWLEPIHPHWERVEQVSTHSRSDDQSENGEMDGDSHSSENGGMEEIVHSSDSSHESQEEPSIDALQNIRRGTETPEESASVLRTVEEGDLSTDDIREARQRSAESDDAMEETVTDVATEKREQQDTTVAEREKVIITFTGDAADALQAAAKDTGSTTKQYAQAAIRQQLDQEGWL